MNRLFVVSLWFQVIWFAAVLGQESWQWITIILGLITLGYSVATNESGLSKVIFLGACGIGLDWLNLLFGLLVFKGLYVPVWLGTLWITFIWYAKQWVPYLATYNKSTVIVLVGCCGALSYWAGNRFSAVEFSYPLTWTLLVLALQWCGICWLILRVFSDGYSNSIDTDDVDASAGN